MPFEVIGKTSNEPLAEVTLYGLLYYAETLRLKEIRHTKSAQSLRRDIGSQKELEDTFKRKT